MLSIEITSVKDLSKNHRVVPDKKRRDCRPLFRKEGSFYAKFAVNSFSGARPRIARFMQV